MKEGGASAANMRRLTEQAGARDTIANRLRVRKALRLLVERATDGKATMPDETE
jgi:hypothetical protein